MLADRIYFSGNNSEERTSNNLMQIQSAITQYRVLTMDYLSSDNKQTTRNIEPFAIYGIHGDFLLIAFCQLRDDFRHFRIDFIENLVTENKTFSPHNMTIKEYFEKYVKSQKYP